MYVILLVFVAYSIILLALGFSIGRFVKLKSKNDGDMT